MKSLEIGQYDVSFPLDANFKLDGGAMFGIIPKPLWDKKLPSDDQNRVPLAARPMLLRNGSDVILVDTGIGGKWSEKEQNIFGVEPGDGMIVDKLREQGIERQDVSHVIFTHLHFDHAGATTRYNEDGELELTFPEATYYVQRDQFEWAQNPTEKDAGSFREEDFRPLLDYDDLVLIDGDQDVLPGIRCIRVDGHTEGLQVVEVSGTNQSLVFVADLIPTQHHFRLPYIMGYDLWPLQTLEQKKELLGRAVNEDLYIAFEHDREDTVVTVEEGKKDFEIQQVIL